MTTPRLWIRRFAPVAAAALLAFNLPNANALVITATTTFDDITPSFGPTNGSFSLTSGGATTIVNYAGSTATSNELTGPLTNVFDGTGFNGAATATFSNAPDGFLIGFDTNINIFNDEGITKEVKIRLDFSNTVNADGPDAYAHSNLELNDSLNVDPIFFSDLKSDTFFGDENGGELIDPPTSGAVLTESGSMIFTYLLNPSDTVDLDMSWTFEGQDLDDIDFSGLAEGSLSANLTVVPLPGSLLFMVSGLLLLPLQRLLRK